MAGGRRQMAAGRRRVAGGRRARIRVELGSGLDQAKRRVRQVAPPRHPHAAGPLRAKRRPARYYQPG
jgi:hypothetical protein